jgi:hypothetical protein
MVYEEIEDEDIGYFVELYRLARNEGLSTQDVIDAVVIAADKLSESWV